MQKRVNYADNDNSLFAIRSNTAKNILINISNFFSTFQMYKFRFQLYPYSFNYKSHLKSFKIFFPDVVGYEAMVLSVQNIFPLPLLWQQMGLSGQREWTCEPCLPIMSPHFWGLDDEYHGAQVIQAEAIMILTDLQIIEKRFMFSIKSVGQEP